MSNTPSTSAPAADAMTPARGGHLSAEPAAPSSGSTKPTDRQARCPSCDAIAAWKISRRHRFSPFGSVLLLALSFWAAAFGWLWGFGFSPALALFAGGLFIAIATRKAEVCEACGYVRPQGR